MAGSSRVRGTGDDEQTVRLARKQFVRRQWARRWLVWRRILAVLAGVGVALGTVWLVFFSSMLAVEAVSVEGVDVLEAAEVRRVANVPTGEPLATVDVDAIAARVEGLAPVRGVEVTRTWPATVSIRVSEREAVAVVDREGSLRGLDADGVLFRDYARKPSHLPLLRMSAATRSEALAEAATVVSALPEDLAARVDHVEVRTVDTITLRLHDGRTVLWGSADDSQDKAKVIAILLDQKAGVYDVSVPGQPTLRR